VVRPADKHRVTTGALFEDRHTDARMRRTIPQFARLGALSVAVTSPFATDSTRGRLALLGLAVVAVVIAQLVSWRNLVDRLSHDAVFVLLLAYCVLIALAVTVTGDANSPYNLLFVIPTVFTAVFFTGWVRYAIAVAAPLISYAIVGQFLEVPAADQPIHLALFLLVAHFGAAVAGTLREALRANTALHSVLEASTGNPLDADLAGIGIDAALSVAGWDAGGVVVTEGDRIAIPAVRGISPELARLYTERPLESAAAVIVRPVIGGGGTAEFEDLAEFVGADHPLVVEGIVSLAALPVAYHGAVIGALLVGHRQHRRLDDRERDRLVRVCEQLGLALGSAAAYRQETQVAENLRELNRRKDEFLANISHELRTPAATIKLVAATLRSSAARLDADQLAEMYRTLERRSDHLSELIGDLLDEAVADAGETRLAIGPIDWNDAVRRWAEIVTLQTDREVTLSLPPQPVTGAGDAVKLERVVVNLLSNAAKFSPPETAIELELSCGAGLDANIEVAVIDHGIGIAPDQLDRIFDRFHQVDGGSTRVAGGFGLGLSLARHFVEAHGGTLTVKSAPGEGSTFVVRVPRSAASAPRLAG
jgi:signal transduction histidine kinase